MWSYTTKERGYGPQKSMELDHGGSWSHCIVTVLASGACRETVTLFGSVEIDKQQKETMIAP